MTQEKLIASQQATIEKLSALVSELRAMLEQMRTREAELSAPYAMPNEELQPTGPEAWVKRRRASMLREQHRSGHDRMGRAAPAYANSMRDAHTHRAPSTLPPGLS